MDEKIPCTCRYADQWARCEEDCFVPGEDQKLEDCPFCDLSKIKSKVVERSGCYVFEPLNPVVPGHLLVVGNRHSKDFTDDTLQFAYVARVAGEIAAEIGGDFNLITSKGSAATQTIFHCHIHLVPRREGDGLALPWTEQ